MAKYPRAYFRIARGVCFSNCQCIFRPENCFLIRFCIVSALVAPFFYLLCG